MMRFWRLNLVFALSQTVASVALAQDHPFIVTTGLEGEIITSFQRGAETYSLTGEDVIEFAENDGVLHVETLVIEATGEPVIDLDVQFERTEIERNGEAFDDPVDPRFTGDIDEIFQASCLGRFDVLDVSFERVEEKPVVEFTEESEIDLSLEPGTVIVGDDPFNVLVFSGQYNVRISHTISTFKRYSDTLTIQVFDSEVPIGFDVALEPDGDINTTFEVGGEVHTLVNSETRELPSEGKRVITRVKDSERPPIVDLETVFEPTDIPRTGQGFDDPIDPRFTGDFDAILAANSLDRFDVLGAHFDRIQASAAVELVSVLDIGISQTPDTVSVGHPDEGFLNLQVITGQLTGVIRILTATTRSYEDTLTIELFAGIEPMPEINLDLCPPPDGDGRIDACDLLLLIEAMHDGTIPERELFEVSRDWLDEEPFGGNRR
ncbi:MAG: hypothetical protein KC964_30065 [Candidatus Omnitrophica bacterium]|nr:hypothetical protein [Candidatus Omnitrophota bacterium]